MAVAVAVAVALFLMPCLILMMMGGVFGVDALVTADVVVDTTGALGRSGAVEALGSWVFADAPLSQARWCSPTEQPQSRRPQ